MTTIALQILILFKFWFFLKKGLLLTQRHNLLKHTMCVFHTCKRAALIGFIVLFGFFFAVFCILSCSLYLVEARDHVSGRGLDGLVWVLLNCERPSQCISHSVLEVTQTVLALAHSINTHKICFSNLLNRELIKYDVRRNREQNHCLWFILVQWPNILLCGYHKPKIKIVFCFNESGNIALFRGFVNHVDREFLAKSKAECHRNFKPYLILKTRVSGSGAPGDLKSRLMNKDDAEHIVFINFWLGSHHYFLILEFQPVVFI